MRMKVAKGGSCFDMNRKLMYEGTVFEVVEKIIAPKGERAKYGPRQVTKETAEDWVKSGYAVPLQDHEESAPRPNAVNEAETTSMPTLRSPADIPGQNIAPPVTTNIGPVPAPVVEVTQAGVGMAGQGTAPGVVVSPRADQQPPVDTPVSPWVLDPESLEGITLETGNSMIAGRMSPAQAKLFTPFETVLETIRYLSQDYEPTSAGVQVTRQE